MSQRFTEAQMLQLAEAYRDNACLWDVNNTRYNARLARKAAYQNIADRLQIPGLLAKDIPNKIKTLRSNYYQELKRLRKSKELGANEDALKPTAPWLTTVDGFLKPFIRIDLVATRLRQKELQTYSCNDKHSNSASESELETQNTEIENFIITEEDLKRAEEESNAADDEVNWGLTSHTNISVQTEQHESLPTYFILPSNKQNVKREIDEIREIDREAMADDVHSAIAKIEKIADRLTQNAPSLIDKREDEFDSFGKYIAMTLRTLPKELAIVGQTDIQKVISEIQLRALRQNSDPLLPHSTIKLEDE